MMRRDRLDSERALAPLRPSADAVRIDNTGQSADATLACGRSMRCGQPWGNCSYAGRRSISDG